MIAAFIRCESDRSPFSLTEIDGRAILGRVIDRIRYSRRVHSIQVLTTEDGADGEVVRFCEGEGIGYFRMHDRDALEALHKCAAGIGAEAAVSLGGDCPLTDPHIIDRVISRYLRGDCDYVSTAMERTFPFGMDVEVFRLATLDLALRNTKKSADHVDPSLYLRKGGKFRRANVTFSRTERCEGMDWRVRDKKSFTFASAVIARVGRNPKFMLEDVLALLESEPEIAALGTGTLVKARE